MSYLEVVGSRFLISRVMSLVVSVGVAIASPLVVFERPRIRAGVDRGSRSIAVGVVCVSPLVPVRPVRDQRLRPVAQQAELARLRSDLSAATARLAALLVGESLVLDFGGRIVEVLEESAGEIVDRLEVRADRLRGSFGLFVPSVGAFIAPGIVV